MVSILEIQTRTKSLTTLEYLIKHYNDLLDTQSSERGRVEVTFSFVGTMYANFQEKIIVKISGKMFQTFHCSNVANCPQKLTRYGFVFSQKCTILAKIHLKRLLAIDYGHLLCNVGWVGNRPCI